jgi:TRAP-type C4-dicarboxylate transport system substrate-binding protein
VARYADGKGFEAHRDQLIQSKGLRMLGAWGYGFSILATKKPVETLAQLKGMKIRIAPSPTFTQMFRLLGANPTPVPFGELYTSLQTGVVEGWVASYDTNLSSKFYTVVKYNNNARLHMGFTNPVIAEKFFQSLPADVQKAILDAGRETTVYNREEIEKAEAAAKTKLAELGMVNLEVRDRPEWRLALQPMYADFEQKHGPELLRIVQGS